MQDIRIPINAPFLMVMQRCWLILGGSIFYPHKLILGRENSLSLINPLPTSEKGENNFSLCRYPEM